MATTFNAKLTNSGIALYTAAVASGIPVQLSTMAVGDGNGNPTTPNQGQTALVREVFRRNLSSTSVSSSDPSLQFAEMLIPPDRGGWAIREVGLFTANGTLFAVANFPETYKPVASEGAAGDLIIRFGIKLANASAITVVIDASIVGATRAWVMSVLTIAQLMPGGTTGQIWRKRSNTQGDAYWADQTEALNIAVDAKQEKQQAADGQDIFSLTSMTTTGVSIYVEGSREFDFDVLSITQVKLSRALPNGTRVLFVQNEPNSPLNIRRMASSFAFFMG